MARGKRVVQSGLTMPTYRTIVLLNLRAWDNPKNPGTGYSLDVVQSVKDGKSMGVGVELVYYKDGGAKRIGKPIQGKDLNLVWTRKAEIKALMDNPPAVPKDPEPTPIDAGAPLDSGAGFGETGNLEQTEF